MRRERKEEEEKRRATVIRARGKRGRGRSTSRTERGREGAQGGIVGAWSNYGMACPFPPALPQHTKQCWHNGGQNHISHFVWNNKKPQEASGDPRRFQEAPGGPKSPQKASGDPRRPHGRPQEAPGTPKGAPGTRKRRQEAPVGLRRLQQAPGGPRRPPDERKMCAAPQVIWQTEK